MNAFFTKQALLPSSILNQRYVPSHAILPLLDDFDTTEIGKSVDGQPIHQISLGDGPIKILMWSQMHGNESTSTRGLFDVLYYLKTHTTLLSTFSLRCIPMLNPDGARAYTRVNANDVDLNRDALDQSQPETKVLLDAYAAFKPDYCFNLHDQRTIFGVNEAPCMLSFLAPAANEAKSITDARKQAMGVIGAINNVLQAHIPGQVGRYDDTYNPNCMGDHFQSLGTPTLLFECGQVGVDYQRKTTRKWFAVSLLAALESIANRCLLPNEYTSIPEVKQTFIDLLLTNVQLGTTKIDVGIQYKETLQHDTVVFTPIIHSTCNLAQQQAHKMADFTGIISLNAAEVVVGATADWIDFHSFQD